ncbi:MAG: hypothetical protein ATN35_10710 [Epulopiscium sp. Nele67-Bin004]|nr:MAG: hypothetical protein ATN35_10710 [Epulopiscium sp. Nele67-Bin004]
MRPEKIRAPKEQNSIDNNADFIVKAKIKSLYIDLNYSIEEISHQLKIPIYQVKETLKSL